MTSNHRCSDCGTTEARAGYRTCWEYDRKHRGCAAEYCLDCSYRGKPCPNCGREKGFSYAPDE